MLFDILIALAVAVAIYFCVAVVANRLAPPPRPELTSQGGVQDAADTITVLTWNLGFAGLGAESDFVADGGDRYRAPSRAIVRKNLAGIREVLAAQSPQLTLVQEVTRRSPLNFNEPMLDALHGTLADGPCVYLADARTRCIPSPLALDHGLATFSTFALADWRSVALPLEPVWHLGLLRKHYQMLVAEIASTDPGRNWIIINIHLAAFDEGATVRRRQLAAVFDYATSRHGEGHLVVIGGDWNLAFADLGRPHTTKAEHRQWIHPFPHDALPDGWRTHYDDAAASVRTLQRPYVAGDNYVTVVDGFAVSPNVEAVAVTTHDLDFAFSDHHPISITVRAKQTATTNT